jgi:hypothetical protein
MSWFERHLNWSLFFAIYLIPFLLFIILFLIFLPGMYSGFINLRASGAGEPEIAHYIFNTYMQFLVAYLVVGLIVTVFVFIVTWWYLGQKARNKWFLLLVFAPFGLIILLLLENQAMIHGGDFVEELATSHWPDTGPYSAPDDRQFKELDYTPNKNVLDISGSQDKKDVGTANDVAGIGGVGAAGIVGEDTPAPEKAVERSVTTERLKMPILLDDAGAVIMCYYHPGADAVNLCSRCKQYVCNECNYVTGTHPICRNCWEKRADVPIAPPVQKQASPPTAQPRKQEVVEPIMPVEQGDLEPMKPEPQKIVAPVKSAKLDSEKSEWLPEFMALYRQALPIINVVTSKSADAMPASPLDLMEGLKLRPMLDRAKKLSKPKDKELREAKNEFEKVLSSCIKIADSAADFVSGGGQALLGGPDFARIVAGIETANGLMGKLSQTMASFPHVQE